MCRFAICRAEQLRLIREGVPERNFGGLDGFFRWLERQKYKMHIRVFMNRWRSSRVCPTCHGTRLERRSARLANWRANIAEACQLTIDEAIALLSRVCELTRA